MARNYPSGDINRVFEPRPIAASHVRRRRQRALSTEWSSLIHKALIPLMLTCQVEPVVGHVNAREKDTAAETLKRWDVPQMS